MRRLFQVVIAAFSLITAVYTYPVDAEESKERTSAEFLEMAEATRVNFISTTISIAATISYLNDESHGDCISEWYQEERGKIFEAIYDSMEDHPDIPPRVIVLGTLQKKCGSFTYLQS